LHNCAMDYQRNAERKHPSDEEKSSMTYYKYSHFLMHQDGPEYEATYKAGTATPFSGIY
jgi:hypothetical protein